MPHRSFAGANRLDVRLESEFGRLFFRGMISRIEYEAGVRYANVVLMYLSTTDAPEPYGREDLSSIEDDECFRRKMSMSAAKLVLKNAGRRCGHVVDRVTVYEQPLRDGELEILRIGLRALAGGPIEADIIPFPIQKRALPV
jgi:hypothetical protein